MSGRPSALAPSMPLAPRVRLRTRSGDVIALDTERWSGQAGAEERQLLADVGGPVLDVGCGPGRLVHHLLMEGVTAMGVDPAPGAVAQARRRGAPVLQRSVWERLPGEGRWATVLLFDGNVGIGGDPVALLRRCAELVGADGRVLAEVAAPGTLSRRMEVRVERGREATGWFPWATVAVGDVAAVAGGAGLQVAWVRPARGSEGGRWFAALERRWRAPVPPVVVADRPGSQPEEERLSPRRRPDRAARPSRQA